MDRFIEETLADAVRRQKQWLEEHYDGPDRENEDNDNERD